MQQPLVHKRQLDMVLADCKRVCSPDIDRPFSSLSDAVDRLLPFHVSEGQSAGCARGVVECSNVKRLALQESLVARPRLGYSAASPVGVTTLLQAVAMPFHIAACPAAHLPSGHGR